MTWCGCHPFQAVKDALLRFGFGEQIGQTDRFERDDTALQTAAEMILREADGELLLVIDQFEEVFALVENLDERRRFLHHIHAAVTDPRSRVRILITLRADLYDRPLLFGAFAELMRRRTEVVLPLSAKEIEQAIAYPAARANVTLEEGLTASILADVTEQPGALPLLQFALTELFEQREGNLLALETYRAIGGVSGALGRRADALFDALNPEQQETAKQLFFAPGDIG